MKSILLHVYDDSALDDRLQVALGLCRTFDAHLTCIQVTPYSAYVSFEPLGGVYTQNLVLDEIREREGGVRERLEARLALDDVRWDWVAMDGPVVPSLVKASALCDLLILGQFPGDGSPLDRTLPIVDELAVHAPCSVLVLPAGISSVDLSQPVVIGWNGSPEAANAIRNALPILRMASKVMIVSVDQDPKNFPQTATSSYLSRHGIFSELHVLPADRQHAAHVLEKFATDQGAACLVMGAYGRSRLRETLLGGVTKDMLGSSKVPLLLNH